MNTTMRRREETSLLCQQEYAEGLAAGDFCWKDTWAGSLVRLGGQAEGSCRERKKEEIKELALIPSF